MTRTALVETTTLHSTVDESSPRWRFGISFTRCFKWCAGSVALCLSLFTVDLFGQAAGPVDFGDAPSPYPTTSANNGAQHGVVQGFFLGSRVDAEPDGQPNANALGDDAATAGGPGDEDGVRFVTSLSPGQRTTVTVVASARGMLDAWIDFDANGSWAQPADQIFASLPLNLGANTLTFLVPASARATATFARFRFSVRGGLAFSGPAPDGEVEDYAVNIVANSPPTISRVDDISINEDGGAQTVNLTGISSGSASESQTLIVTALSQATTLIPNPTVTYTSPNTTGALTFTPSANANGLAILTVTVNDGGTANSTTSITFGITVNPVNDAPSFRKGADQSVNEDGGAQSVPGWAAALSAGPVNEASQVLDFIVTNNNNGLFISQPSIAANGTLTYTPAPNANGNATVSVQLHDNGGVANRGVDTSPVQTFAITVTPVNDPPTLDGLKGISIIEDSGTQTVSLTGIGSGAVNENQTLTITASSSNPASIPNPTVNYTSPAATGSLTFAPTPDANGTTIITVTVKDGGSTNNTTTATFTVVVNPVNDAPSFRKGVDPNVVEDSGPQSVPGWASAISAGPADEANQVLDFRVSNNNSGLFSAQPAISANGTLTYTPALNASGTAIVSVQLHDNGGTANGGMDTSVVQTFLIVINPVNDPPTLDGLKDRSISEDSGTQTVSLTGLGSGAVNENQALTITVASSNQALIPNPTINYTSPAATGSLTFSPTPDANGTTIIALTVKDGGSSNNTVVSTFTVTVTPVNDSPTLSPIANISITDGAAPQTVNLAGITTGAANESQTLSVTSVSSNPALIPSPTVNYTSPNTTGTLTFTPTANTSGTAVIMVTVNDGGTVNNTVSRTFSVSFNAVNKPPTIASLPNLAINEDDATQTVALTGLSSGGVTENQLLVVTATSSNPALIPNPTITYLTPNSSGSLTFKSSPNAHGTALITVTVDDAGLVNNITTTSFSVLVNPVNDAPIISAIPDQLIDQDTTMAAIPFSIADVDNVPNSLGVTAKSSNQLLVPDSSVTLGGAGASRTVSIQPAPGQSGNSTITITVSDGLTTASRTFILTVTKKGFPPTIVTQPLSQSVDQGTEVIFGVEALGGPGLTYQWRFNQNALPAGISPVLIIRNVQTNQGGLYDVVVANPNGSVTSTTVALTVHPVVLDFGDAPFPYPTLQTNNGARHAISPGFQLGSRIDAEADGQPNANALGDDLVIAPFSLPASDEDGVSFGTMVSGQIATVVVVASQVGRLDAWIDFDVNGNWAGAADQIFVNTPLAVGANTLTFAVPSGALPGSTFARFRLSKKGGLPFDGPTPDGEVEDYRIQIRQPQDPVDMMIIKSGSPNPVTIGANLVYSLLVRNNGPASANNVIVTDPLPPNVSYISATSSQGICNQTAGGVTCMLGNMVSGAEVTISIVVIPTTAIALTNTACVSATNPDTKQDNNCATVVTDVAGPPVKPPCDLTNGGTDFWLAFPANYAPDPNTPAQLSLHLTGPANVSGKVTIPGLGFTNNWSISSGIATVNLPGQADLGELNNLITNKGIHITATAEVSVYALTHLPFTSDAYMGLPSSVLGTEYIVLGYPNVHTDVPKLSGTQFAIVAPENNTIITIIPRVSTGGHPAGSPFTLAMNQGDTYQLRNTNNAPNDLSGTVITANKPIAVFGGHQCANIKGSFEFFCDTLIEQLLPTTAWGTNFVATPLATRINGDTYRIVAAQPNTVVTANGVILGTLNRGDLREKLVTGSVHITANKPVMVAQYANSSDYDSVTNSDPFMVMIPATKLFRDHYLVYSMTNGFTKNFLNVVVPASLTNQILLDGSPVPSTSFSSIPTGGPASGFFGAQLAVGTTGRHALTQVSSNSQPFGVTVYGFGPYDSYAYPGGMRLGECPLQLSVTITAQTLVFQWPGTGILESAVAVVGPWKEVLRAQSPYIIPLGGPGLPAGQYYRLR